jgi:hypothetical protein
VLKPSASRWKIDFTDGSGMVMASSLSPFVSNIFMKYFEELALNTLPQKPAMWFRNGMRKLASFS